MKGRTKVRNSGRENVQSMKTHAESKETLNCKFTETWDVSKIKISFRIYRTKKFGLF